MRISDWSSDVCSSDLRAGDKGRGDGGDAGGAARTARANERARRGRGADPAGDGQPRLAQRRGRRDAAAWSGARKPDGRSEERSERKECGSTSTSRCAPYNEKNK